MSCSDFLQVTRPRTQRRCCSMEWVVFNKGIQVSDYPTRLHYTVSMSILRVCHVWIRVLRIRRFRPPSLRCSSSMLQSWALAKVPRQMAVMPGSSAKSLLWNFGNQRTNSNQQLKNQCTDSGPARSHATCCHFEAAR